VCSLEKWMYRRDEIRSDSSVFRTYRFHFPLSGWIIYRPTLAQPVEDVTLPYARLRFVPVPLTTSQDGYLRRAFHGIRWMESLSFYILPLGLIPVNYRLTHFRLSCVCIVGLSTKSDRRFLINWHFVTFMTSRWYRKVYYFSLWLLKNIFNCLS